jgi:hypothetical protein
MFPDWQTVAVCLIILAALAYLGRRGLSRARSFRPSGRGQVTASSCASGCGGCGDGEQLPTTPTTATKAATVTRPQNVLVQITNAGGATRRRG